MGKEDPSTALFLKNNEIHSPPKLSHQNRELILLFTSNYYSRVFGKIKVNFCLPSKKRSNEFTANCYIIQKNPHGWPYRPGKGNDARNTNQSVDTLIFIIACIIVKYDIDVKYKTYLPKSYLRYVHMTIEYIALWTYRWPGGKGKGATRGTVRDRVCWSTPRGELCTPCTVIRWSCDRRLGERALYIVLLLSFLCEISTIALITPVQKYVDINILQNLIDSKVFSDLLRGRNPCETGVSEQLFSYVK